MKIDGRPYRTIFPEADGDAVMVIDQTRLPFAFELKRLASLDDAAVAIRTMVVRGAPLIGVTAAYGMALAMRQDASEAGIERAVRDARRDPADRDQPALGARPDGRRAAPRPAIGA
ncbi:UNVERIFIED_ORG: methylthioribose-1-phosphate isomerase [Methylorubrum zatmanii]|nr:methylthioribose-1-phosphate isomerase [Methylorubrum zatmanii]